MHSHFQSVFRVLKSCTIQHTKNRLELFGNDCAGIKVNFAHEKLTGNNCAGIKVNSEQLEITVKSAF